MSNKPWIIGYLNSHLNFPNEECVFERKSDDEVNVLSKVSFKALEYAGSSLSLPVLSFSDPVILRNIWTLIL